MWQGIVLVTVLSFERHVRYFCDFCPHFQGIWRQWCSHIQFRNRKDNVCAACEVLQKDIAAPARDQDKLKLSTKLVSSVEHAREKRTRYLKRIKKLHD